ncbi:cupin domain-containing protein [Clostridium septicum]|uniref:Cupin domain-containing protein n=1 Tax=Clostridium septicum TaxID=1504 RepID=A0A9N7JNG5_CLOSE|nr:cupin domain-containing protein [Clostridium septicum]AYE35169.1 ethanolamine utilization protein EutQ [Clostridium septicum]MDU1313127.1 cupin domain-containing protein [Clostridium septicum]QAS60572.1 DUF861 domain-containing protein [Clostridium septicum]UEC20179.1 cupin domain-containing protein [Clostridium septicum]USS01766.1 cupin domain-containing protein [Clostridium septicum]
MKKLICAKDIEELIVNGKKTFYIDGSEIITPAAQDLAINNQIKFTNESPKVEASTTQKLDPIKCPNIEGLDSDTLVKFFKVLMEKGLLQDLLECLKPKNTLFDAECDPSGLKVVRGNTVKMDVFDTGDPNVRAYFQELVSKEESKMSAGFLVIENSKFEWELTYEEIDYVIEGTLTVEINGKTYTAHAGDVLFVPSGSKVVWGSPDKARVFYSTYPANWADLL